MKKNIEERPDQETKDLAFKITQWVNTHNLREYHQLIKLLSNSHRTLQQKFTGVCLAWITHLSSLPEEWYDLRNEASVQISKKIVNSVEEVKWGLPLI